MSTEWIVYNPGDEYPNYDGLEISSHNGVGPIYYFKNVKIEQNQNKNFTNLSGKWMIVGNGYFYGHYLQETIGPLLYYKKNIDKNLKILWVDQELVPNPHGHNLENASKEARNMLFSEGDILMSGSEFLNSNFIIEDFITFFNNIRFIPSLVEIIKNYKFKGLTQHNNTEINKLLRSFYGGSMKDDPSLPKKLFLSRKRRSMLIEQFGTGEDPLRYAPDWYHNAIEDYFRSIGYEIIEFSGIEVSMQAKYLYNADHVAGIHGTAFLNGIFCKPGTSFVSILSEPKYLYKHELDAKSVIDVNFNFVELYDRIGYQDTYDKLVESMALWIL